MVGERTFLVLLSRANTQKFGQLQRPVLIELVGLKQLIHQGFSFTGAAVVQERLDPFRYRQAAGQVEGHSPHEGGIIGKWRRGQPQC